MNQKRLTKKVKVSAPGKIILSGEHSVVYGKPAILAAVDKRLTIEASLLTKGIKLHPENLPQEKLEQAILLAAKVLGFHYGLELTITSEVPIGSGMGSSAAFASGLSAAILSLKGEQWDFARINEAAYEIEKLQHGNPSGGDNTISTYGGFLWYRKESENLKVFTRFNPKVSFSSFFLVNSGKPEESTKDMVLMVKERYQRNPGKVEKIFKEIESCTKGFLKYLTKEENSNLRELIKTNEVLLEELGVVSFRTRDLIKKLAKIGTFAKVSGAGGMALGSGMLLAYPKDRQKFLRFAKSQNLDIISVKFGGEGVRKDLK